MPSTNLALIDGQNAEFDLAFVNPRASRPLKLALKPQPLLVKSDQGLRVGHASNLDDGPGPLLGRSAHSSMDAPNVFYLRLEFVILGQQLANGLLLRRRQKLDHGKHGPQPGLYASAGFLDLGDLFVRLGRLAVQVEVLARHEHGAYRGRTSGLPNEDPAPRR